MNLKPLWNEMQLTAWPNAPPSEKRLSLLINIFLPDLRSSEIASFFAMTCGE
jgi:hypothetical protein